MKSSLRSLTLKGFRSFVKPSTIQLPKSGLVLISGANLDASGVSSGSGKSSLLLAISHALGYCPFSATDLQAWSGSEDLEVELELETAEGSFLLKKGGKSSLAGPAINVTGSAATQSGLQKLIGMDSDLLSALTYRPQKTHGLFLSKTNSEMQEFLTTLLGLHKFEAAIESSQTKLKDLEGRTERQESVVLQAKANYEKAIAVPIPKLWDIVEHENLYEKAMLLESGVASAVEGAQVAHTQLQDEAKAIKQQTTEAVELAAEKIGPRPSAQNSTTPEIEALIQTKLTAEKRFSALLSKDSERLDDLQGEISTAKENVRLLERDIKDRRTHPERISLLEAQVQKLKESLCPRCEQTWHNPSCKKDLELTEHNLSALRSNFAEIPALENNVTQLLQKIAELRAQTIPDPKCAQMSEIVKTLSIDIASKQAELRASHSVEIARWDNARSTVRSAALEEEKKVLATQQVAIDAQYRVLFALMKEHSTAMDAKFQAKNRLAAVKKDNEYIVLKAREIVDTVDKTAKALAAESDKLALLRSEYAQEADLLEVLKAFLTAIFDEVLDEIAYNTNQMLALVPNVAHVTLRFKSESVTQKGTIKRAITPVLTIGGGERPLKSSLSGGMSTAVELAVDLAVRKVVSARSGVNPGWLILDECFEGLGVVEKEACLELLKQAALDTLILVVDHGSETKELFDQRILVEYSDGQSKVVTEE
jgi:DNA repair exonuclease SbcCD ATPase subunit